MLLRVFSCAIALLILSAPVYAQVDEMQQAKRDAERDVEKYVSLPAWGAMGFACGCLGIAYIYFSTPEIPVGVLLGKSPTYVGTYTRVYRDHAKRRRLQAAAIGCGIGNAVSTVSYYLFVLPLLNQYQ